MRRRFATAAICVATLAAALACAAPATTPEPDSADAARAALVARLDSLARAWVLATPVAGLSVAVVRGTDTLLLRGYGERDRERHLPAETGTIYRIGSLTKQVTAAAILRLADAGRLRLTDTLGTLPPSTRNGAR